MGLRMKGYEGHDHPFQVGGLYANRNGEYEVLEIKPPKMTVRYHDGGLLVADIAILARIWDNLHAPPPAPEPKPRATTSRAAATQRTTPTAKPATTPRTRTPRAPRTPKE